MTEILRLTLLSASALALAMPGHATAQTDAVKTPAVRPEGEAGDDIVVTGIRQSLEKAASIKREAIQVVDSIVAQDIGKFPDPTTAAALQRVPGVQVSVSRENELTGVRIRGLADTLTTVNGREVFTTSDRSFDLQDIPASALARVDVVKSQTADLIEGGVAGVIDLRLNKPFSFTKPTMIATARGNYGERVDKASPQLGLLVTDRWTTGIGDIGVLLNGSWSRSDTVRTQTTLTDRRNSAATPIASPGYFLPNIIQNIGNAGTFWRTSVNGALQWQVSPAVQAYVDGLYTRFHNQVSSSEFNIQTFTTATKITNVVANVNCFAVRSTAAGQNPTILTNAASVSSLQPFTTPTLCDVDHVTFTNAVANQTAGSRDIDQINRMIAGGLNFEQDRTKATLDLAYQRSTLGSVEVRTAVGQRLSSVTLDTDVDGAPRVTVAGDALTRTDTLSLRNQLIQNFQRSTGSLFQARADLDRSFDGILDKVQVGVRFADRTAQFRGVQLNTPVPFGNIGTATEANAKLVSASGLPSDFLALGSVVPRLNGGSDFFAPSTDFMRSDAGRDALRAVYNLPSGDPAYDPSRQFDATEKTYAAYAQATYAVPLGGTVSIDGVVGVRATRSDRVITTMTPALTPLSASGSDTDFLPNATIRLRLPAGLQTRLTYAKTIRRPDFAALNPAITTVLSGNPAVQNTGSAGNPNLLPQKSDSYDATFEYYGRRGFVALTGYYRQIVNRVITTGASETIGANTFIISRPRNVGQAQLKGLEMSGQYFFDFLPGPLAGLGTAGAFTIADSNVKGGDPLAGLPLIGVSKYNYTATLLYDKYGVSGRLAYTFRSKYAYSDLTGSVQVRGYDSANPGAVVVPPLLEYARPAGRLDLSLGYDVTPAIRVDVGGTNLLHTRTRTYLGNTFFSGSTFDDETSYTAGIRVRI